MLKTSVTVGLILLFSLAPAPALAAPVTAPVCDPAAATAKGDPTSVTIPDDAAFRAGRAVAIQVNGGDVQDLSAPHAFGHVPICSVMPNEDGTAKLPAEWLFCLEREKYGCEDEAGYDQVDGEAFTALQRSRLAWVFASGTLATPRDRAELQATVWCITDKIPANQVNTDAVSYYASRGITITGQCPDWPTIDPTLPIDPNVKLVPLTSTVAAGGTARFKLDTNIDPVTITAQGGRVSVCPDSRNGTLQGSTLRLTIGRPVLLCLTRTAPGQATISVERHGIATADMEFWQYSGDTRNCQVLLRQESAPSTAHATASVRFGLLPVTGDRTGWVLVIGVICLLAGAILFLLGRKRVTGTSSAFH